MNFFGVIKLHNNEVVLRMYRFESDILQGACWCRIGIILFYINQQQKKGVDAYITITQGHKDQ